MIFGKFHRRGVESVSARELVLRSRGTMAQLRQVGYVCVCRGAATTRVRTNDDACAEIQPCEAKANYELCDAGNAPGASASSRRMREDILDSADVVFAMAALTNAVKAPSSPNLPKNTPSSGYGVATSLVVDDTTKH